jgi:hypothetical protein
MAVYSIAHRSWEIAQYVEMQCNKLQYIGFLWEGASMIILIKNQYIILKASHEWLYDIGGHDETFANVLSVVPTGPEASDTAWLAAGTRQLCSGCPLSA